MPAGWDFAPSAGVSDCVCVQCAVRKHRISTPDARENTKLTPDCASRTLQEVIYNSDCTWAAQNDVWKLLFVCTSRGHLSSHVTRRGLTQPLSFVIPARIERLSCGWLPLCCQSLDLYPNLFPALRDKGLVEFWHMKSRSNIGHNLQKCARFSSQFLRHRKQAKENARTQKRQLPFCRLAVTRRSP